MLAVTVGDVVVDPKSFGLGGAGWQVIKRVRKPWGQVPLTGGGVSLPSRAREYMDRLAAQHKAKDPVSRRHHYVPQTYLRQWSFDGKRYGLLTRSPGRSSRSPVGPPEPSSETTRAVPRGRSPAVPGWGWANRPTVAPAHRSGARVPTRPGHRVTLPRPGSLIVSVTGPSPDRLRQSRRVHRYWPDQSRSPAHTLVSPLRGDTGLGPDRRSLSRARSSPDYRRCQGPSRGHRT
jgi:hypothetical protein